MESILFVLDAVIVAMICYMAMKDDRRPRGAPASSLFRYRDGLGGRPAPARRFKPGDYQEQEGKRLTGAQRR